MFTTPMRADLFRFAPLEGDGTIAPQLSVTVTSGGSQLVDFTFRNNVGLDSSVTDIYFYDGEFLDATQTGDPTGDGVSFTKVPTTPPDLPGMSKDPTLVFSIGTDGNASLGIDTPTDYLTLGFSLATDRTFDELLADLRSGEFVIGLRVQSIDPGGNSGAYITVVPLPGAVLLGLLGLGYAGLRLRRFS